MSSMKSKLRTSDVICVMFVWFLTKSYSLSVMHWESKLYSAVLTVIVASILLRDKEPQCLAALVP
jgi:hypothetical protein